MRFGSFSSSDLFKTVYKHEKSKDFRTDIAGLRGIAVMLVVLCHFKVPGFSGGFIGPDIFFVLSGYLITGLLVREYQRNASLRTGIGSVSLRAFYLRRARRILPAALFVVLCINLYAFFKLNVLQVDQIKSDSLWTVFFAANIAFLRQATDYFAQGNAVSPLQHYWSLSVEEQFYTVWPVLFLVALSFRNIKIRKSEVEWQTRLRFVFTLIGLSSFAWLLYEFTTNPTTSYFSTFSRAWELALGGLLSMVNASKFAEKLTILIPSLRIVSLAAVVGAITFVTPTNFGYTLIVPAVATGLLLLTGATHSTDLVHKVLSTQALNALGAISFSLYLWHWPVFVFGDQLGLMDSLSQRLLGILVCIILAIVSYWLIEKTFLAIPLPQSKRQTPPRPREFAFARSRIATTSTLVAVLVALTYVTYPSIFPSVAPTNVASEEWVPPASAESFAPTVAANAASTMIPGLLPEGMNQNNSSLRDPKFLTALESVWSEKLSKAIGEVRARVAPKLKVRFEEILDKNAGASNPAFKPTCDSPELARHCVFGNPAGKSRWLLLGDSPIEMFTSAFYPLVNSYNPNIRFDSYSSPQCPNSLNTDVYFQTVNDHPDWHKACMKSHDRAINAIKATQYDVVIFSDDAHGEQPLVQYQDGLQKFVTLAKQHAKQIVILGQVPVWPHPAECLDRSYANTFDCSGSMPKDDSWANAQNRIATLSGGLYVDMISLLCRDQLCPLVIGGIPVTKDGNHISWQFAREIGTLLIAKIAHKFPNTFAVSEPSVLINEGKQSWSVKVAKALRLTALPSKLDHPLSSLDSKEKWSGYGVDCMEIRVSTVNCKEGSRLSSNNIGAPKLVLLGDSYAQALIPALTSAFDLSKWNIRGFTMGQCMVADTIPMRDKVVPFPECKKYRDWVFRQVKELHPDVVVVHQNSGLNYKGGPSELSLGLLKSLQLLHNSAKKVILVGSMPHSGNLLTCLAGKIDLTPSCFPAPENVLERSIEKSAALRRGAVWIDPLGWLCAQGRCPAVIDNSIVTWDGSHLTTWFAKRLGPLFKSELLQSGVSL